MAKKGVIPNWYENSGRPRKNTDQEISKKQESYNSGKNWYKDWRRKETYFSESELKRIYIKPQWDEKDIKQAYCDYYNGKYSYRYLSKKYNISVATLKKYFALITYKIQLRDEELAWKQHYREMQRERDRLLDEQRMNNKNGKRETEATVPTVEDLFREEWDKHRDTPENP